MDIIYDIQTLFQGFHFWKVCYTPHETNAAAHYLAKEDVTEGVNRI
jgi:hypothetical protein